MCCSYKDPFRDYSDYVVSFIFYHKNLFITSEEKMKIKNMQIMWFYNRKYDKIGKTIVEEQEDGFI